MIKSLSAKQPLTIMKIYYYVYQKKKPKNKNDI